MPRKRALWAEEQLKQAMESGNGMADRKASVTFRIPRTLRNHLSTGKSTKQIAHFNSRYTIDNYLKKLKDVMTEIGIIDKPQCIFNLVESGCQLNLHKEHTVFAKKVAKRIHLLSEEHAQNVTVVSCGNALDQAIPPMILMLKGVRQKPEWSMHLPPGSVLHMTPKASMTTEMFVKWMEHVSQYKHRAKFF
ncbi:hypothetical protein JTB14_000030 [Gonioctena quinquepunctata]|nr:hypothetical protein JTB14_000030 [Gonioctena quinquepunctata]